MQDWVSVEQHAGQGITRLCKDNPFRGQGRLIPCSAKVACSESWLICSRTSLYRCTPWSSKLCLQSLGRGELGLPGYCVKMHLFWIKQSLRDASVPKWSQKHFGIGSSSDMIWGFPIDDDGQLLDFCWTVSSVTDVGKPAGVQFLLRVGFVFTRGASRIVSHGCPQTRNTEELKPVRRTLAVNGFPTWTSKISVSKSEQRSRLPRLLI